MFLLVGHTTEGLRCQRLHTKHNSSNQLAQFSSGHQFHKVSLSLSVIPCNNKILSEVVTKTMHNLQSICHHQPAKFHHHLRVWLTFLLTRELHSSSILPLILSRLCPINNQGSNSTVTAPRLAPATAVQDHILVLWASNRRAISSSRSPQDMKLQNQTTNTKHPNRLVLNSISTLETMWCRTS